MNELSLIGNLFDDALDTIPSICTTAYNVPDVDVKADKDAYTLEMDLPGRTEKDVDIQLDGKVLTIESVQDEKAADTKKDEKKEESGWLIRERRTSSFKRSFTLPEDIDGENVTASFRNGVLTVSIPRKEQSASKRIAIEAA